MRTLGVLTIVCLVFYGVATEAAQGKSHLSNLRQHLERARSCSMKCVEGQGSVDISKNWVIRINVNIYLVHSAQYNYLAIYNINLGIAVVYDNISRILLIVNVKTGDSVLISDLIGLFVKGSRAITQFNNDTGVYDGTDFCYEIIIRYKVQITANTSRTMGGYFSIEILLNYLLNFNGEIDLTTVVNGRTDLAVQLKAAFGFFFQLIAMDLKKGSILGESGSFILLKRVLDLPSTSESEDFYIAIFFFFYILGTDKLVITTDIINHFYSGVTTYDVKKLTYIYMLFYNVGILYDTTAAAFFAYDKGYFSNRHKSVTINGDVSMIVFSRDSNSQDWNINIRGKSNLFILYYYNINSLVFLNWTYGLVIVFPSRGTVFTVYNGITGVAIAISKLLGTAKVIETNSGAIAKAYLAENFKLAISLMVTATTSTSIGLFEHKFVFAEWLDSVYRLGTGYTYKLNSASKSKIDANFKALITNFIGMTGYNRLYGSINVLLIGFKELQFGYLPSQFVLLVSVICVKLNALFHGSILAQVYYAVRASVSASFSVSAIFTFIPGGGGSVSSSSN